jgi:hypothetical protein
MGHALKTGTNLAWETTGYVFPAASLQIVKYIQGSRKGE